ncbi:hypothetical protein C6501_06600 [Candidatus Poribacteria bacterium]|nr:MAG: hypothetical protein C6501_06600 [Candidatus Poribacteria bacterium]
MRLNLSKGLTHVQEQVSPDSLTNDCGGEGCKVYRTDIPRQKIVINVEKEFDLRGDSRKRCDRLLFYRNRNILFAVPIELKGRGKGDESQVLDQLKSGLEFAATLVQDLKEPVYVPIVFTKRGIREANPKHQKRELKMKFKGKTLTVLTGRCGRKNNLANLLSEAGYL